ncbi:MAG: efflux RND transporter permease subunit [Betaproteobacteria bacterium]|nr:efflux RND transporter permease subunit [Betaproteobacteria bacterium]
MKHAPRTPSQSSVWNLSALALRWPQVSIFFIAVIAIAGAMSYFKLGQREDPDFTFRAMVIRSIWPGASAEQTDQQVTDRIEKKLQEIPYFKHTRSYSRAGESLIVLELLDTAPAAEVPQIWYQVRKKIGDLKGQLPADLVGPFFNDEFGDVFGSIWAFTGDGFSLAELKRHVEQVRQNLLRIPDVSKIELIGVQDEKIYIEVSSSKLAALGLDPGQLIAQLQTQNLISPSGVVHGPQLSIPLRISGGFETLDSISKLSIFINGRSLQLSDIARVHRAYQDPPVYTMRYGGKEAIGLAVSMVRRGDVLKLGSNLDAAMLAMQQEWPAGIQAAKVSDQPRLVKMAVGLFMQSLLEAVAIVLAVSFLSLGLRAGGVVALTIPLVLAATFLGMAWFGIDLHRVSTGALIIALGLLVDDAMIVVEMMARKIEEGFDRFAAATYAFQRTAFPMLTGTLITAAGFLPIATAKSSTGEYTFAIFAVVSLALLVSWVAAVLATPFLGYYLLKSKHDDAIKGQAAAQGSHANQGQAAAKVSHANQGQAEAQASHNSEVFDSGFYRRLRALINWCMRHANLTILATVLSFVLGVFGMAATEKQFFPSSDRAELLVEMWLPEGSSLKATELEAKRLENILLADKQVSTFVSYVGNGSPRYYLSLDQQLYRPNFAQFVILTSDVASRDQVLASLRRQLAEDFPGVRARVFRTPLGPPVAYPIQFRVMGPDPARLKEIAAQVANQVRANPSTVETHIDWGDQSPVLRVEVDQDKARAAALSTAQIRRAVSSALNGTAIGQYREYDQLIDIVLRSTPDEREQLDRIASIQVTNGFGKSIPLEQLARIEMAMEEPIYWRRSRMPTLTVRADMVDGIQAPDLALAIDAKLGAIKAKLPPDYRVEIGGPFEDNLAAQASINAGMPMMLAIVCALLMLQLRTLGLSLLVLITAPLGIVGVAGALLLFSKPFGFVAMLGTIALGGMIMRNTVILVEQIRIDCEQGAPAWQAVRESAVRRFRPIVLTAAAAILAMIPLSRDVLWGPMALAIMGGLLVATVLTLLVVPALYVRFYRVKAPT